MLFFHLFHAFQIKSAVGLRFCFSLSDAKDAQKEEDRNCEHLARFFMHWEKIEPLFSEFFEREEQEDNHSPGNFPWTEPENQDDINIFSNQDLDNAFVFFDPVQSRWRSKVSKNSQRMLIWEITLLIVYFWGYVSGLNGRSETFSTRGFKVGESHNATTSIHRTSH